MTRSFTVAAIVAMLLSVRLVACDGRGSEGSSAGSRGSEPLAAVLTAPSASEIPSSAGTTLSASGPPLPECLPPVRAAQRTLAKSWPAYLGRRVSLSCRAVRRIDLLRTFVTAGDERFVVMGPPEVTPCAARSPTFTVIGSTAAPLGGRTVLPELLLEDDRVCAR